MARRPSRGIPRHEDRQPRHQRRHDARPPDPRAGGRARTRSESGGAPHRHQRSRGRRNARRSGLEPPAAARSLPPPRPADAGRALPGVPQLAGEEAAAGGDPEGQRALSRGGEEQPAGHPAGHVAPLRERRRQRTGRGVPGSAASERGRLRALGGSAPSHLRHARLHRDGARFVPARRGIRAAVQRPRPHRLGLPAHVRRLPALCGRRRTRRRRSGRSSTSP